MNLTAYADMIQVTMRTEIYVIHAFDVLYVKCYIHSQIVKGNVAIG